MSSWLPYDQLALRPYNNVIRPPIFNEGYAYPSRPLAPPRYGARPLQFGRQRETTRNPLSDGSIEKPGDLGWTVDYATAWCYRFLVSNQPEIVDILDKIRQIEVVRQRTPFVIFDALDEAIFGSKLKGNVCLKWKASVGSVCGKTYAPDVIPGIKRTCIELNSFAFGKTDRSIDGLLKALLHQMIHAFFLVCCGTQKKEDKPDDRLLDGVRFGVLLLAIRDITRNCEFGQLPLTFHATHRIRGGERAGGFQGINGKTWNDESVFIALDPRGTSLQASSHDRQTHCSRDNRNIRPEHLRNWQVQNYALALDLELDARGDTVYDLTKRGELVEMHRMDAPPSSIYVELLWNEKRIMITREKVLKHSSLRKPINKNGELKMSKCSEETLRRVHEFIGTKRYGNGPVHDGEKILSSGAPVLHLQPQGRRLRHYDSCTALDHVRVFKAAEDLRFDDLETYALRQLNSTQVISEDPVELLTEVYRDGEHEDHSISARLLQWARDFLAQGDAYCYEANDEYSQRLDTHRGVSNYQTVVNTYGAELLALRKRNTALDKDCRLVEYQLVANRTPLRYRIPVGVPLVDRRLLGRDVAPERYRSEIMPTILCWTEQLQDLPIYGKIDRHLHNLQATVPHPCRYS